MIDVVVSVIIITLSFQVMPVAIGIDHNKGLNQTIWFALVLLLGQSLLFLIGYLLGERFMHLMENFKGTVIFIGFFLIGIRMIFDGFKVRKGERTYVLDSTMPVILASLAQGINTFLAGLLLTYLPFERQWMTIILTISTLLMVGIGAIMKPGKTSFSFASFLFLVGGFVMIFSSIYLGFF